jgi:predicted alpha/beta-fold hydrolase
MRRATQTFRPPGWLRNPHAGVRPYVLNFRSCSGEPNRRLRSYHSGETGDIAFVAGRLAELHPGVPLGAIGYSLGGNALLCRLAEAGATSEFGAAAAVSVPFDLSAGADCLEVGMGRVYTRYFLGSLHEKIVAKARRFPGARTAAERALRARTIRGIDETWTAPIHGFRDADHYYEACSSLGRLCEIAVPTLLLQAADDPFLPPRIPAAVARVRNPALETAITHFGGHLGYVARDPEHRLWAEARAATWLARRLHAIEPGDQR